MNEAAIRVLVALAASDAHGNLVGNDPEGMVTLFKGREITGYIPREVIDNLLTARYLERDEGVRCHITEQGRVIVRHQLEQELREAWSKRILGGLTGAFYPLPTARRAPAITAAMIGLGWLEVLDGNQPHKFTNAAKTALGILPASVMSPEERRAADQKAQVEKDRIAYEQRLREASRVAIKSAEAEVVKQARAVLHSTDRRAALNTLFAAVTALEVLEQADDLRQERSEQPIVAPIAMGH